MINQLNGTIAVESREGKYTRFVLTLPIQQHFIRFNQEELLGNSSEENNFSLQGLEGIKVYAMCDKIFHIASKQPEFDPSRFMPQSDSVGSSPVNLLDIEDLRATQDF